MSVVATSTRTGWHLSQPPGPGRTPGGRRPAGGSPTLTVTFSIPLASDDGLTPQAFRLLEVARELVERGEGTVSLSPPAAEPLAEEESDEPDTATAAVPAGEGTLRVLAASRTVLLGDQQLRLTRLEFDLLLFLAENPRRVFSRLQLLTGVWGYEHAGARTVDVHIRRLRSKIGMHVPLVTTVYGVGYRLADDARVVVDRDA
ncbi:winged helix-turn-helix domain-containing protein [Phytohabitans sp. ZYX-F-186]|uniref:Winged helix-turn-helix domain-containing protein n=1 Tax=Phytohabitans maris TaxID=3071409 RepID=A0ABU0ZDC5_9ACTN|nr:winged helix-turn-helix domain-containing protein [Phytohabitans sp. ZYX-F-186]MDQ7903937.1 winged helix-turn-helix domain-containing protein [Phytohabitans sp. ZYX-F-186]